VERNWVDVSLARINGMLPDGPNLALVHYPHLYIV
jgi:hypothetical protein